MATYGGNGQGGRGATSSDLKEGGAEWLSVFAFCLKSPRHLGKGFQMFVYRSEHH